MFKKLMNKFIEKRNEMINDCTKNLLNHAGISIPNNATNFDIFLLYDDLRRNNYKIVTKEFEDSFRISLIKLEDLYENEVVRYDIEIKYDISSTPEVSLIAIKTLNKN
ncbi:MAG: hypothetical protein PHE29_12410 [Tissierellia bacterium]|nr:hypothetical protein [Tissierellia bacterium]MDD4779061.1 hypothetical protein [Tissierellia bacterium]